MNQTNELLRNSIKEAAAHSWLRWVLTLPLLVEVCLHAHWSVTVCVTLSLVGLELDAISIRYLVKVSKERS